MALTPITNRAVLNQNRFMSYRIDGTSSKIVIPDNIPDIIPDVIPDIIPDIISDDCVAQALFM